jgi:HlyD family secretion protein
MPSRFRRLLFWAIPLLALAAALAFAFWPRPVEVDLAAVERGPMVVSVAEEGMTRIRDVFTVYAPVRGRVRRIEIDEGDPVIAGETMVAEIEPTDPEFLDLRSEAEARAAVEVARAALAHANAELSEATADLDFATAEVDRTRELRASGTVSARTLQAAERLFRMAESSVATREAAVEMRRSELEAAQVRLLRPSETGSLGTCPCVPIRAPVSGRVLRVLHESEGVVPSGEPLVEIGNPGDLEVVADFLSSDAVRIEPGQRALIEDWGAEGALNGRVARVEPYGFTKVSALGIEEQRVNVVIELTDPPERWQRLGHGFEVDARVVLWEADDVPKLPITALFRQNGAWAVFAVVHGRAAVREVEVGQRTDLEAELVAGLEPGDVVVRYPNDFVEPGVAIRQR